VGKGTVTALRAAGEQRTSAPAAQPLSKCVWMEILDSRRVDHPWSGSQTANTPSRLWGVVSCTLRGDAEEEPIWTPGSPVRSRKAMHTHRFGTRTPARLLLAPLLSNRAAGKGGASLPPCGLDAPATVVSAHRAAAGRRWFPSGVCLVGSRGRVGPLEALGLLRQRFLLANTASCQGGCQCRSEHRTRMSQCGLISRLDSNQQVADNTNCTVP
jgi:hypothetical protein